MTHGDRLSVERRLALDRFEIFKEPHIVVEREKCLRCELKPCIGACPAGLYSLDEEGALLFNYEGCLECGTCRLVCPYGAVRWNYPPGGFGVHYQFG